MNQIGDMLQSCCGSLPQPIGPYVQNHLNTIPKVLKHVLIGLVLSNIFLLFHSMGISSVTFFASFLLIVQTVCVIMVTYHDQLSFAPQRLQPSEFIVGMCLGLCVGGVILAFFLSVTFRRAYAFCKYAEEHYEEDDHEHACPGSILHRCWSIWWWSSVVFWLDLGTAILIAAGRPEIALYGNSGSSSQGQYQSIGGNGVNDSQSTMSPPSSFQQPQSYGPPSSIDPSSLGGYSDTSSFGQASKSGVSAHVIGV